MNSDILTRNFTDIETRFYNIQWRERWLGDSGRRQLAPGGGEGGGKTDGKDALTPLGGGKMGRRPWRSDWIGSRVVDLVDQNWPNHWMIWWWLKKLFVVEGKRRQPLTSSVWDETPTAGIVSFVGHQAGQVWHRQWKASSRRSRTMTNMGIPCTRHTSWDAWDPLSYPVDFLCLFVFVF